MLRGPPRACIAQQGQHTVPRVDSHARGDI